MLLPSINPSCRHSLIHFGAVYIYNALFHKQHHSESCEHRKPTPMIFPPLQHSLRGQLFRRLWCQRWLSVPLPGQHQVLPSRFRGWITTCPGRGGWGSKRRREGMRERDYWIQSKNCAHFPSWLSFKVSLQFWRQGRATQGFYLAPPS